MSVNSCIYIYIYDLRSLRAAARRPPDDGRNTCKVGKLSLVKCEGRLHLGQWTLNKLTSNRTVCLVYPCVSFISHASIHAYVLVPTLTSALGISTRHRHEKPRRRAKAESRVWSLKWSFPSHPKRRSAV